MRPFIELSAKGDRRIIVETSAIVGVLTPEKGLKDTLGTPNSPVTLVMRNAPPIDVVGIEAVMVLARITEVTAKVDKLKETSEDPPPIVVQWLDLESSDG